MTKVYNIQCEELERARLSLGTASKQIRLALQGDYNFSEKQREELEKALLKNRANRKRLDTVIEGLLEVA